MCLMRRQSCRLPDVCRIYWYVLLITIHVLDRRLSWIARLMAIYSGKISMEAAFQGNANIFHIRTKCILVAFAIIMTVIEKYHATLRKLYHIKRMESLTMDKTDALQMSVKASRDSAAYMSCFSFTRFWNASLLGTSSELRCFFHSHRSHFILQSNIRDVIPFCFQTN